jgi:hypothetical protein
MSKPWDSLQIAVMVGGWPQLQEILDGCACDDDLSVHVVSEGFTTLLEVELPIWAAKCL